MSLKRSHVRKLGQVVSFQSPEKAKESARTLVHLYEKAGRNVEKKAVVATARKAAQQADDTNIRKIYWTAHDHLASDRNPSPSIRQTPASIESKSSSASNESKPSASNQTEPPSASSEKGDRSASNQTKPDDGKDAVTYSLDPETNGNGNRDTNTNGNTESNRNGSDDSKENGNESKSYRSDYHEFVSKEMENYDGMERRSGEALKEIGRKWKEQKKGASN